MPNEIVRLPAEHEARLNITFAGCNGDLLDPVPLDATDADVRAWATEAVRQGSVPGIPPQPDVAFHDFVVDRFTAAQDVPYARLFLRPKTPFGM